MIRDMAEEGIEEGLTELDQKRPVVLLLKGWEDDDAGEVVVVVRDLFLRGRDWAR